METYMSHDGWRREPWKGHSTKKDVRAAIRYTRGRSYRNLRIFERVAGDGTRFTYREVLPEEWDTAFAE